MNTTNEERISGKYTHFKGQQYDVFCSVYDRDDNKYVLYQQCYGDGSFWIRPYDMFFSSVEVDGKSTKRFTAKKLNKLNTANSHIAKLICLIENDNIRIRHTETEQNAIITHIDDSKNYVMVHLSDSSLASGYLTEYEILRRLGFNSCRINGEIKHFKSQRSVADYRILRIGDNNIENLRAFINPCSIDLQIASSGFLKTRFKLVDPQSIEHVSSAKELWKPVKKHSSKCGSLPYFKIAPGATILTHTKERIRIPKDCAGKIEIKSTFARLSLSITFGDFCNPGYDGYFPLEIKNNGKHTVIIHEGETMAQLMLIPLRGPILDEYTEKATFKNSEGYDDGTPYTFWEERSIKALRKKHGTEQIIQLSHGILSQINADTTPDINAYKERFKNTFLPFCHKKINKTKHLSTENNLPDAQKLLMPYVKKEKRLKRLFGIKWLSGVLTLISIVLPIILTLKQNAASPATPVTLLSFWPYLLAFIVLLIATFIIYIMCPKTFCTFEKIDFEKIGIAEL